MDRAARTDRDKGSTESGFIDRDGGRFYRVAQSDQLAPFLMTIVSASDHWLFVASNGGLTAGRRDASQALFPYRPADQLYDSASTVGPFTVLLTARGSQKSTWQPFAGAIDPSQNTSRHLYKSIEGNRVIFEEINHDLSLTFSAEWTTSDRFGFVRRARLSNDGSTPVAVKILDGLRHILPAGIPRRIQSDMSCLSDAYKRSEAVAGTTLATYALSAGITDQPEALESLVATVVWSTGLPHPRVLLSEQQFREIREGRTPVSETDLRGLRGVYSAWSQFTLEPKSDHRWMLVADTGLSQAAVTRVVAAVRRDQVESEVDEDIAAGTRRLRELVGASDGLQGGADEATTSHHFANVLFNIMRGGTFLRGYRIPTRDFARFVGERNRRAFERHADWLMGLPLELHLDDLNRQIRERNEANLERLSLEYLPLGFSRRHGDPSRPWNNFSIRLRDHHGRDAFEYEGNWRDIFQNWEALGTAYPGFFEHMVAKFVNASTLDGYNPYRVTRRGIEWETPAPEDPWAGIGYWGDHQVVYLLRLLEWAEHFAPGRFHQWLEREVFSYAAVPYRIATYEEMRRDPRSTIRFESERHAKILSAETTLGGDARLVRDEAGEVRHVTLTEKLILCALARLASLVPGGGIWMNTQRPEWNDANNALAGFGVSGVTLCYLRRYLAFCRGLFADYASKKIRLSSQVADFAKSITQALVSAKGREAEVASQPKARRALMDQLSEAGTVYRTQVYEGGPGESVEVAGRLILDLIDAASPLIEASIRTLTRSDGLFHAYRLLHFTDEEHVTLDDLPPMLEGQVAVLASGAFSCEQSLKLLRSLRLSPLYRADVGSYILYPDKSPPGFLARNIIPSSIVRTVPLLDHMLEVSDNRLVERDAEGQVRFNHDLVNEAALGQRLNQLSKEPRWAEAIRRDETQIRAAYETVFHHRAFTGRSGAMFAYEGLGSVYWHMVSKLLLAVQEVHAETLAHDEPAARALAQDYFAIRSGLGFQKTPAAWGAFPTDPYSHTPGHAGAQQPGMTGQAKEGILTRLGELGVAVVSGCLRFFPTLLREEEFRADEPSFTWFDARSEIHTTHLPPNALAFTFCGALIVYTLNENTSGSLSVRDACGNLHKHDHPVLPAAESAEVFARTGRVTRIDVSIPRTQLYRATRE